MKRTPILALRHRKEVHRASLSDLLVKAEEPEHLVVPQRSSRLLRDEARGVIQSATARSETPLLVVLKYGPTGVTIV